MVFGQFRVGALLLALGSFGVWYNVQNSTPALSDLAVVAIPLTGRITIMRVHNSEPLYAAVPMGLVEGRISEVCDLWQCRLPDSLAELRRGDTVRVWMQGREIWQLAIGQRVLVSYGDIYIRFQNPHKRSYLFPVLGVVLRSLTLLIGCVGGRRTQPVRLKS